MTSPTRGPRAQKLGPGTLQLGEVGTGLDLSCQVTEVTVTWDNDTDDDLPVLCGDVIPGDDTFTAELEATIVQDMVAGGVIDYTWKHRGEVVALTFTPTEGEARVTGRVKIIPVDLGGEVRKKNSSDVTWPFVGEPTFTPMADPTSLAGTDEEEPPVEQPDSDPSPAPGTGA